MAKQRKTPLRTCVACRKVRPKRELVRIVRAPDGKIAIDTSGKMPGRGASVCPSADCFELAAAGALARSLQVGLDKEQIEELRACFLDLLRAASQATGAR
jgi:predicted RNA-binding protein YlxR (DUF448 family)